MFREASKTRAHLDAGARKVVITAPGKHEGLTVVLGVNERTYDPAKHHIISNASCTTNGLASVAKVGFERFGIEKGIPTTVHAYANSQRLPRSRDAGPARRTRGCPQHRPVRNRGGEAVGLVIPELKGKFTGMAFLVPTSTVSVVDFTVVLSRAPSREAINAAMKEYAEGPLKGILAYSDEPLVSSDLKGNPASSIFSALDTLVIGGDLAKVVAWYDNEWGYSVRVADLVAYVSRDARASMGQRPEGATARTGVTA